MEDFELKDEGDGEFWMNWNDFINYFSQIDVCHLTNNSIVPVRIEICNIN